MFDKQNKQNEQNDFAEIVTIQQTLFRNLKSNHRFYLVFALSSIPFWVSFIVLALLIRAALGITGFTIVPMAICFIIFISVTLAQNMPLIVRGSNQLRAITKTRTSDDDPVKFLPGIAKYVNTMYQLISNPTFPKRRKDKISSTKARKFEVSYFIQFVGFFFAIALIPTMLAVFEPSVLSGLNFIIPFIFLILSYLFFILISIKVIRNLKDWQLLFTELEFWAESIEKMSIVELTE